MPRTIHIQFRWTDESVMLEDFSKKTSKRMLEWAVEFYRPYQIALDVAPAPNVGSVALAHKFALVKNGGVEPDMELSATISARYEKREEDLEKRRETNQRKIDALNRQLTALPANDSVNRALIYEELTKLYQISLQLSKELIALLNALSRERALGDYETQLRIQMANQFVFNRIGDEKRLDVVFCKFRQQSSILSPRRDLIVVGQTLIQAQPNPIVFAPGGIPQWLWPYPCVLLDIQRAEPQDLAHELVHTVGELHPPPQTVVKNLEKLLNYRPVKSEGSMLDRAITEGMNVMIYQDFFKTVPGGNFDGPKNDIMNYSARGTKPSEFVLKEADLQRFFNTQAPFVTG